ncbi:MAG: M23 family metallopeptidase [Caulobacter sp.]|nr:M23 family metallopeptidase [Caulobacter sp.]
MAGPEPLNRRALLGGLTMASLAGPALAAAAVAPPLGLAGRYRQGGCAIGLTSPRARIWLGEEAVGTASAAGYFFLGFDRDAGPAATVTVETELGATSRDLTIAPGDFDVQRIGGLPRDQVTPTDPALLARIRAEAALKTAGYASRIDDDAFREGFAMPLKTWRLSARFGGQRILNGVPQTPHHGSDLAAPTGAPITAPAAGLVVLANPDMHYEGGLIMIDHGQGLVTVYLHQSRLDVRAGDRVSGGQVIGAVGMKGRATGPHLCWRMRWRGRNLDPMLMVGLRPVF